MSVKTFSIEISKNSFDPPIFVGYFTVVNNTIVTFYDNSTSTSCLLPGIDIYNINLPDNQYPTADNFFDTLKLRFSFNGVLIKSSAIQKAFHIEDSNIINLTSYNNTLYCYSSYLSSHTDDPTGINYPQWSSGNVLYHFNDIYAIINIKEIKDM